MEWGLDPPRRLRGPLVRACEEREGECNELDESSEQEQSGLNCTGPDGVRNTYTLEDLCQWHEADHRLVLRAGANAKLLGAGTGGDDRH